MNQINKDTIYDIIGVGIGPFNLGLAALLEPISEIKALFLEQKQEFAWHPGLLIESATIQVPFLADVVTMADPTSKYSFLNYLKEHSRLYHFYFWEDFHILRNEYNYYCQWVSQQLKNCKFGQQVKEINWLETEKLFAVKTNNFDQIFYSQNLVLGVGSTPKLPPCFQGTKSERIFHSSQFLQHREIPRQSKSITVVGSGQSAAEIFYELLQEQEIYNYEITWCTRAAGFLPMEYSKLGLEHFSPDYIHYFYNLSPAQKDSLIQKQDLLYKGISSQTIAQIYDLIYQRSIGNKYPKIKLVSGVEVKEVKEINHQYHLTFRHSFQDERWTQISDCVILGTGYNHAIPKCMQNLHHLIAWDEKGRFPVNFNYQLTCNADIPNRIFVQNAELHTHGVGAPDLGLGCYRNSVIINTLLGKEIYPVRAQNVFQKFGLPHEMFA
ncbi:MAG: lysine 6-monooxygenase [Nostocales cyanobacterium]|nr:MAG: lysine 6-monooxygenase [Nostocales cyanobacterium]TAF13920.1 MAG: lysine 6-monooxygenase [Nostocales cyanobacterium]